MSSSLDSCTLASPLDFPSEAPDTANSALGADAASAEPIISKSEAESSAQETDSMEPTTHQEFEKRKDEEQVLERSEEEPVEEKTELTLEERLIEKLAEFEGKDEALRILKANLYLALEQLDNEQRAQPPVEKPLSPKRQEEGFSQAVEDVIT